MSILQIIFTIVIGGYLLERVLDYLNATRWSDSVPDGLKDIYDENEYRKAQQYEKANKRIGLISDTLNTAILLLLLHCGTFGKLDDWAVNNAKSEIQATLLFFGIIGFASEVINLPFSIYRTFVIEEHFGFNKTSVSLFIKDKIKGYLLAILLLGGILALFSYFYHSTGSEFWIYAWVSFSIFMVLMSMFYTSIFLPIFNKLKPLETGELRSLIESYCKRTGFGMSDVLVMDGSKRSSKANAFFSGLGSRKKIVLYDTLIQNHTSNELVAVLAHETGHYKLKHTFTGLILSVAQTGIMLYLFSLFMESVEISKALGGTEHTIELGLLSFGLLYTPVSLIMGIVGNLISRHNEYRADAYAAKTSDGTALRDALKKLSVNNLSNLDPHPAYVFFYYSHPPLLHRLNALEKVKR